MAKEESSPTASDLAELAFSLAVSNPAEALAEGERALMQARHEHKVPAAIRAWYAIGTAQFLRCRMAEALEAVRQAKFDLRERFGLDHIPAPILVLESDIFRQMGELKTAFELIHLAEETANRHAPLRIKLRVELSIAFGLAFVGEDRLSLARFEKIIAAAEKEGFQRLEATAQVHRCYALNALGRYEESLRAAESAEARIASTMGPSIHAELLDAMGEALTGLGRPSEGESRLRESLIEERHLNREIFLAFTRLHLAKAYLAQGRHAEGENLARASLEAARFCQNPRLEADCCEVIGRCLENLNRSREAAPFYRECLDCRRNLEEARYKGTLALARLGYLALA